MRYLIALLGLALILPRPAAAQAYDWRPINHDTAGMIKAGQYDTARPIIEDALTKCPNAATPLEAGLCTAIFTENLSGVLEHQGDLAGAEADLRKMVEIRTSVLPANDPLVSQAYVFLAQFFLRHGRWADEIAASQAAETIARADGPTHRIELAGMIGRHAAALTALGKPGEALPLYQEAYDIARAVGGPTSHDALVTLGNLFTGQINAGQPDAAIDAVSAVLASPDAGSYDPTQRALLAGLLALQTSTTPRSKAALAFVDAALPDLDNGLVDDANASFTLLRGAARLNAGVGDAKRAVELARRARDLAARTWGPDNYAVANALRTEAEADAALHDFAAGISRLHEAAALLNSPQFGFDRVGVEVQLGTMLSRAGRDAEAVADHQAVLGSPVVTNAVPVTKAAMLALLGQDLVRLQAFGPGAAACAQASELAAQAPSLARDYVVKALLCSGNAALAQGRASDALDIASRVRAALWAGFVAPAEPNRITQIEVADLRSRAFRDSHRSLDALPAYREELALAQKAYSVVWQGLAWGQIADLQRQMRLYKDSDQSSLSGLAVLGTVAAPRIRANLLNNRALLASTLGRPADVVPLFEAALVQRRADPEIEPLMIASGERDLAAALQTLGRNRDAGRHMDAAIDGYRALGTTRIPFLVVALDRRAVIAVAAGDPARAETAFRELLALQDPASDDANKTRITLAGLLDNQGQRQEASGLRSAALTSAVEEHGANSAAALGIRLAQVAALRASGRLTEAELGGWQCEDGAKGVHDLLLPCLMARAETALEAGSDRQAAEFAGKALVEAETHWTRDGGTVVQALILQARIHASFGDVDAVIRLYDRIHGLTPDKGISRTWTDCGEGQLLTEAGELTVGPAMLRLALKQGKAARNTGLAVAATQGLASQLEKTGRWEEAIGLWQSVLPLLSDDAPVYRVKVLEGLGTAAAGMARYQDAARFLGEAVSLSRTVNGVGSPDYGRLVLAWSAALMRSSEPDKAEDAIRLLDANTSPAARRLRTVGMMHLASMADDPAAAVMLARSEVADATAAFGAGSVGAALARLDLIEESLAADKPVDGAELDDALRVVEAQVPSWAVAYRGAQLRGELAAHMGRLNDAATAFLRAEVLASAHEGFGSLAAAIARSDRASVRLRAGKVNEANQLFRQALAMAAPDGQWRNMVWARIAGDAAAAAERAGDISRATSLLRDADGLKPQVKSRATVRWI